MQNKKTKILITAIILLVAATVTSNYMEEFAVDRSKLPEKVERHKDFQKWLTNHKKRKELTADEFKLISEREIFNAQFLTVYSTEDEGVMEMHDQMIASHVELDDVKFSPSERQFLDYKHEERVSNGVKYTPFQAHYYGLREDTILDSRVLGCLEELNCYYDRAFFLDNDSFVISEVSRNIHKDDVETAEPCGTDESCTYTFKLHVIDLNNNSRLVYESNPQEFVLDDIIEFF